MRNLDKYFNFLELEMNFSEHTINKYHHILNDLNQFAGELNKDIDDLMLFDLKQYNLTLVGRYYAKSTQAQAISVIKSYYKYLLRNQLITDNPASGLIYPKKDLRLPKVLYESELFALFDSIDTSKKFGKRNLAIMTVLYSTGMRISEVENLSIYDFTKFDKTITVIGKGNKERIVPINKFTFEVVREYIELERSTLCDDRSCTFLWINNKGGKLTARGIRYITNQIVDYSALLIKVSPHTLRHSFASHLLNAGMDIRMVQELLGHESLSTTEVYTHLDSKTLSEKYNKLNLRR